MGSKSALLRGKLGERLVALTRDKDRFVDLFAGSAAVSIFVAERCAIPVISVDIQQYSSHLALSVIGRDTSADPGTIIANWIKASDESLTTWSEYSAIVRASRAPSKTSVAEARRLSQRVRGDSTFITNHYGGHYYSPLQAASMDALFSELPASGVARNIALGALIRTASRCAAAPGHTAQPFQPTTRLMSALTSAWSRDVFRECTDQVNSLARRHALKKGRAMTADAMSVASNLKANDLVFCDPPYSAVQYSRFYHVLEGIARGGWDRVEGAGRSPLLGDRHKSDYSLRTAAADAMSHLLDEIADRGCTVALTFPAGEASNSLSGLKIAQMARRRFRVESAFLPHTHSTLGGGSIGSTSSRTARLNLKEILLVLEPRD